LLLIASAGVISDAADAQTTDSGKIAIFSRTIKIFGEAEQALDDAVRNHDDAALTKLLAADFELRQANNPGTPVPRADWLAGAAPNPDSRRSQMTVHDHGTLAIVSFLRDDPAAEADQPAQRFFLVDVWQKQDDSWQLLTRYQSESVQAIPPTEDVVPTGKG
jgi:hypothetical protein